MTHKINPLKKQWKGAALCAPGTRCWSMLHPTRDSRTRTSHSPGQDSFQTCFTLRNSRNQDHALCHVAQRNGVHPLLAGTQDAHEGGIVRASAVHSSEDGVCIVVIVVDQHRLEALLQPPSHLLLHAALQRVAISSAVCHVQMAQVPGAGRQGWIEG